MRAEQERFAKAIIEALVDWWRGLGSLAWIGLGLILLAGGLLLVLAVYAVPKNGPSTFGLPVELPTPLDQPGATSTYTNARIPGDGAHNR